MNKSLNAVLFIFLTISILLFTNNKVPFFYSVSGISQQLFEKPKSFLYSWESITNSGQEEKLRDENIKLVAKLTAMQELEKENQALKSQFLEGNSVTAKQLPAKIVGYSGSIEFPTSMTLDKGERDGIKKGMAVVVGKNLVGIISVVLQHYATIILPTNKNYTTLVKTSNKGSLGILRGEEDFMVLEHVVITDPIAKEDIVVTRGESSNAYSGISSGIIVGKISTVNKKESESFQDAKVMPVLNYSRIINVFVRLE